MNSKQAMNSMGWTSLDLLIPTSDQKLWYMPEVLFCFPHVFLLFFKVEE